MGAASLCAGWRVREVVAHVTMPFRYRSSRILTEMIKAGGNFNRMADRLARRDATALSDDQLARSVADSVDHPWRPPGGGYEGALSHNMIHGLDITVPLGIARHVPEERLRMVLRGLASPKRLKYFGVDLRGVELRADDMDWSYGTGSPIHASGQNLLLVLCGRRLSAGGLRGENSERFTAMP
jgi:uncharacterized protein (TIGR03083 family)